MDPKGEYHLRFNPKTTRELKLAAAGAGHVSVPSVIKQLVAFGLATHPVFGKPKSERRPSI